MFDPGIRHLKPHVWEKGRNLLEISIIYAVNLIDFLNYLKYNCAMVLPVRPNSKELLQYTEAISSDLDCRVNLFIIAVFFIIAGSVGGFYAYRHSYALGLSLNLASALGGTILILIGLWRCFMGSCSPFSNPAPCQKGTTDKAEIAIRAQFVGDRITLRQASEKISWYAGAQRDALEVALAAQYDKLNAENKMRCFCWNLVDRQGHQAKLIGYSPAFLEAKRTKEQNSTVSYAPAIVQAVSSSQKVYFDYNQPERKAHLNRAYKQALNNALARRDNSTPEVAEEDEGALCQCNELLYLSALHRKRHEMLVASEESAKRFGLLWGHENSHVAEIYDAVQGVNLDAIKSYLRNDNKESNEERQKLGVEFAEKIVSSLKINEGALFAIHATLTPALIQELEYRGITLTATPMD
jgi:hypothetical protein